MGGLAVAGAIYREPILGVLTTFQEYVADSGPWGMGVFAAAYVLATVLMLPGWILTVIAGMVWGLVAGTALVSFSSVTGATCAFLLARSQLRPAIESLLSRHAAMRNFDTLAAGQGWKIVLLLRLSPLVPFNLLNYGLGLSAIPLREYVPATMAGMLPGTFLYVYLGSLGNFFAAGRTRSAAENFMMFLGLAATLICSIVLARIARRAVQASVSRAEEEQR